MLIKITGERKSKSYHNERLKHVFDRSSVLLLSFKKATIQQIKKSKTKNIQNQKINKQPLLPPMMSYSLLLTLDMYIYQISIKAFIFNKFKFSEMN